MMRRLNALARACGLALLAAAALAAQRAPVLQQVDVPHPYYWRNLYVPQLTTGPSSVAWMPDGNAVVVSRRGQLWLRPIDGDTAVQLTDGAGYDYQPDVSPDGRSIVFATYHHDAIELHLLDLTTGTRRALTSNGGVNLEPRWSHDGRRIVWVSTQFGKRWHLFVADVQGGALAGARRITADVKSDLPRYYYSIWDHAISPAWSRDDRELVYVSNAGHIWGAGGIWRAPIPDGAGVTLAGREIRDEETTWGARPDWSPDGRRIVYASYAGRQWHQLWLMSADGKNPLQLTYGDFDATNPRWSPDGSRIAFIANESGDTDLRVVTVRGGAIRTFQPIAQRPMRPVGRLALTVLDADGRIAPARVSVTDSAGHAWGPIGAWLQSDDSFDRRSQSREITYFHSNGAATLPLPAGAYTVTVWRGFEHAVVTRRVTVPPGAVAADTSRPARIANMASDGWHSADLHVHMNYGGPYRATRETMALQARAEGLDLVEALVVNKEGRVPDIGEFLPRRRGGPGAPLIEFDQEFHTSLWGHTGLLGMRDHLLLPGYASYQGTAASSPRPTNSDVAALGHAQGALFGYVHPFDEVPDPANASVPLTNAFPVDVALGNVDYMEILGFADHASTAQVWYKALNAGFRIPAGAGTDAMTNFASLRGPLGLNRVYVKSALDADSMRAALKAGRSMATNGPLLSLSVNGQEPGAEVRLLAAARTVRVRATLRSFVGVDHLELVVNGAVAAELALRGDRTRADTTLTLPLAGSAWITLRARGDSARSALLDMYPFATTSPVYVLRDRAPIRSANDARWLLRWVDRLEQAARAHAGYDTEAERAAVLAQIAAARAMLAPRAQPSR